MWEAMRRAELGWPRFGEDESLNLLCERGAALLGKPAAIWAPTCGMANLVALLTFCEPGDRVVLETSSHVLSSEGMAIAEIARLEPRPVLAPGGRPDPDAVEQEIRESGAALLVLENTHTRAGGTVLSADLTEALAAAATRHGCRVHVDGARLANAAVALGVPLAELAGPAELGRPVAEQGPLGAVRGAPRRQRDRRRASDDDPPPARRRHGAPRGHRRRRRARRSGHDGRAPRRRPPARARPRRPALRHPRSCAPERPGRDEHRARGRHRDGSGDAATLVELLDAAGVRAMSSGIRARCGSSHTG